MSRINFIEVCHSRDRKIEAEKEPVVGTESAKSGICGVFAKFRRFLRHIYMVSPVSISVSGLCTVYALMPLFWKNSYRHVQMGGCSTYGTRKLD